MICKQCRLDTPTALEKPVLAILRDLEPDGCLDVPKLAVILMGSLRTALESSMILFDSYQRVSADVLERLHAQGVLIRDTAGWYRVNPDRPPVAVWCEVPSDRVC
jgi:hypothetical protein